MDRVQKEQMFISIASQVRNGSLESLTYFGEVKLLKGGRKGTNPYYGRVTKSVKVTGIQFGVEYCNIGGANANGTSTNNGLSGCKWEIYPVFVRSLATNKLQLRCSLTAKTKFVPTYYVDGRIATDSEVADIKSYLPSKSASKVFNITIEKVVEWKVNGNTFADNDLLNTISNYKQAQ